MHDFQRAVVKAFVTFSLALSLHDTSNARAETFGNGINSFTMEFVEIGNWNNPDDTTGVPVPAGSVAYNYRIAKQEVSRDMITKYNRAHAWRHAAHPLQISMFDWSPFGESRSAMPATEVSWYEAASFVNWLNTNQGYHPAYNLAIKPFPSRNCIIDNTVIDTVLDGQLECLSIKVWEPSQAWQLGGENLLRHKDAHYFLPSMDEWYKAAYHQPGNRMYFEYPMELNRVQKGDCLDCPTTLPPTSVASGTAPNTAVYAQPSRLGSKFTTPADVDQAGGLSPHGVMGLGGNVWEWEETTFNLANDDGTKTRGIRGGDWKSEPGDLSASSRSARLPDDESFAIGFRVASLSSPTPYWQNPSNNLDVDNNQLVIPLDALLVINELNLGGSRSLDPPPSATPPVQPPPYIDVNGDQFLSPIDALQVINAINGFQTPSAFPALAIHNDSQRSEAKVDIGNAHAGHEISEHEKAEEMRFTSWDRGLNQAWLRESSLNADFKTSNLLSVYIAEKHEQASEPVGFEAGWTEDRPSPANDWLGNFLDPDYETGTGKEVRNVPEPYGLSWIVLSFGILWIRKYRSTNRTA